MINMKRLILKYKYKYLFVILLIIAVSLINTLLPYIIKQTISLAENNVIFEDIKQELIILVGTYIVITIISAILGFLK